MPLQVHCVQAVSYTHLDVYKRQVKDLVAYGREQEKLHDKKFRFTLTTNGILLNDEVQMCIRDSLTPGRTAHSFSVSVQPDFHHHL